MPGQVLLGWQIAVYLQLQEVSGELGARHIRVAMTASDAQIADAAARIQG